MKTKTQSTLLDSDRIDQYATSALILGVLAVFQSGIVWLYWLGLVLLVVGASGILVSQIIQKKHIMRIIERMAVVCMIVGILGMLQSWQIKLYENGFYILSLGTLAFIVALHIKSPVDDD